MNHDKSPGQPGFKKKTNSLTWSFHQLSQVCWGWRSGSFSSSHSPPKKHHSYHLLYVLYSNAPWRFLLHLRISQSELLKKHLLVTFSDSNAPNREAHLLPKVGSDGQPAATAPRKSRTRPHHFRVPMKRPKTHLRLDAGEKCNKCGFFCWTVSIGRQEFKEKMSGKSSSKGEMMVQERSNAEISSIETFYTSHPWHEIGVARKSRLPSARKLWGRGLVS